MCSSKHLYSLFFLMKVCIFAARRILFSEVFLPHVAADFTLRIVDFTLCMGCQCQHTSYAASALTLPFVWVASASIHHMLLLHLKPISSFYVVFLLCSLRGCGTDPLLHSGRCCVRPGQLSDNTLQHPDSCKMMTHSYR